MLALAKTITVVARGGYVDSYYGRPTCPGDAPTFRLTYAPMARKPRGDKHLFSRLDPKPITVGRDLGIIPPRKGETLVNVLTTKDGDIVSATYHQEKPRVTIKGIRVELGQVKIPPKTSTPVERKKKAPPSKEV